MSLLSNSNKKDGKKGKKTNNLPGANNNLMKPAKAQSFAKRPPKTGGTRGS
ncbi:hypothetical protein ACWKWU_03625 [Chitinophaga lutea]